MQSAPQETEIPPGYRREYLVCEPGIFSRTVEFATTLDEAQRKAKKYVHLHAVEVHERLIRTVCTFPKIPVCT